MRRGLKPVGNKQAKEANMFFSQTKDNQSNKRGTDRSQGNDPTWMCALCHLSKYIRQMSFTARAILISIAVYLTSTI